MPIALIHNYVIRHCVHSFFHDVPCLDVPIKIKVSKIVNIQIKNCIRLPRKISPFLNSEQEAREHCP